MLHTIQQQSKTISASILLITITLLLAVTSCNKEIEEVTLNTFTGEEYFEGIFFAHGPFTTNLQFHAENLRTKQEMPIEYLEREDEYFNEMSSKINEANPAYFNQLKEAIETKNHTLTKQAIMEGGELVLEYLKTLNPIVESEANAGEPGNDKYEHLLRNNTLNSVEESGNTNVEGLVTASTSLAVPTLIILDFPLSMHNAHAQAQAQAQTQAQAIALQNAQSLQNIVVQKTHQLLVDYQKVFQIRLMIIATNPNGNVLDPETQLELELLVQDIVSN